MKVGCALVIAVIAAHLQCAALCIAAMSNATEPPCHKHAERPSHDKDSPCNSGSTLQSKTTIANRFVLPELAAVLPATTAVAAAQFTSVHRLVTAHPLTTSQHSLDSSVLRI
jgi:hypothetical protein